MEGPQHFTAVLHRWAEVFMRRSMHDFMRFTKKAGLSMSQLSTLMRLYHHGGCVVSDIADSLDVSNAAASQMVERLVNLGLIGRSEDPEDRRVKQITLTMKGRQLIQDSIDARQRWMQEMTDALTPEEQESISVALTTLTEAALAMENTLEQECTPEVV